jgi:hypothetical protein
VVHILRFSTHTPLPAPVFQLHSSLDLVLHHLPNKDPNFQRNFTLPDLFGQLGFHTLDIRMLYREFIVKDLDEDSPQEITSLSSVILTSPRSFCISAHSLISSWPNFLLNRTCHPMVEHSATDMLTLSHTACSLGKQILKGAEVSPTSSQTRVILPLPTL